MKNVRSVIRPEAPKKVVKRTHVEVWQKVGRVIYGGYNMQQVTLGSILRTVLRSESF